MRLKAPPDYWTLSPEKKKEICNGCGAKGGMPVPDTIYGLRITEVCNIHDFMYHIGVTELDREMADEWMLDNMRTLINNSAWYLRGPRKVRAKLYYRAVRTFGKKPFFSGKEKA